MTEDKTTDQLINLARAEETEIRIAEQSLQEAKDKLRDVSARLKSMEDEQWNNRAQLKKSQAFASVEDVERLLTRQAALDRIVADMRLARQAAQETVISVQSNLTSSEHRLAHTRRMVAKDKEAASWSASGLRPPQ